VIWRVLNDGFYTLVHLPLAADPLEQRNQHLNLQVRFRNTGCQVYFTSCIPSLRA
jgi:hypothetical protein